jgi:hypothetical protein
MGLGEDVDIKGFRYGIGRYIPTKVIHYICRAR